MNVKFTARRFRAHADLRQHAIDAVNRLDRFYDGIVSAEIILSFERAVNSVKTAEINLQVYGAVLSARDKSEDFLKSIDAAVAKLEVQLTRYKTKLHMKNKAMVRTLQEKL